MKFSQVQRTLLDFMRSANRWVTRQDLAAALHLDMLTPNDLKKLEALFQAGYVAKRVQPSTHGLRTVYEYRFIPQPRQRDEIVTNVLREYYDGEWIRLNEIAYALGDSEGQLSDEDSQVFKALLAEGVVENQYDPVIGAMTYRVAG
jgi:predicted transcriptional regulator